MSVQPLNNQVHIILGGSILWRSGIKNTGQSLAIQADGAGGSGNGIKAGVASHGLCRSKANGHGRNTNRTILIGGKQPSRQ
jgi:hypothetical protein